MTTTQTQNTITTTTNKLSASCSLVLQQIRFLDVPLPRFDISEIKMGRTLGEGRYCTVQEIVSFPLPSTTMAQSSSSLASSGSSASSSSSPTQQGRQRSSSVPRNLGRGVENLGGGDRNQRPSTASKLESDVTTDKQATAASLLGPPPPPPPSSPAAHSFGSPPRPHGRIQRRHSCHASMKSTGTTHQQPKQQQQPEDTKLTKLLQQLEVAQQQKGGPKKASQERCRQQLAVASRKRKTIAATLPTADPQAALQTIDEEEDDDDSDCDDAASLSSTFDDFSITSTLEGSPHNSSKSLLLSADGTPAAPNSSYSRHSEDDEGDHEEARNKKNPGGLAPKTTRWPSALSTTRSSSSSSLCSFLSASTASRSGGSCTSDGNSSGSFASRPRAVRRGSTGSSFDASNVIDKVEMRTQSCFPDGTCRYVIKRVREDFFASDEGAVSTSRIVAARTSLAMEAHILTQLSSHPQIVRLRGVLPDFSLVLDRLENTLDCRMEEWAAQEARLCNTNTGSPSTCNRRNILRRRNSAGATIAKVVAATVKGGGASGSFDGHRCTASSSHDHDSEKSTRDRKRHDLWTRRLMLCYDVSLVMKYLESQGIILRDLRPENVGLDRHDAVKLFDFGGAKEIANHPERRNTTMMHPPQPSGRHLRGNVAGVMPYMAPELYQGRSYGPRVDSYSFGILLWEVLALRRLVPEQQGSSPMEATRGRSGARGARPRMVMPSANAPLRPKWNQFKTWPESIRMELLPQCCSLDPLERPDFGSICQVLMTEVASSLMTEVDESNNLQNHTPINHHKTPSTAAATTPTATNSRRSRRHSLTSLSEEGSMPTSLTEPPPRRTTPHPWQCAGPTIMRQEEGMVTRIAV